MSLKIALKIGDEVKIGDAVIRLDYRSGNRVGLSIDADKSVKVTYNQKPVKDGVSGSHRQGA